MPTINQLKSFVSSVLKGRFLKFATGWWLNHPVETYARQNWFIFPKVWGENSKTYLKPPPSQFFDAWMEKVTSPNNILPKNG